jgi:hypothetical protein
MDRSRHGISLVSAGGAAPSGKSPRPGSSTVPLVLFQPAGKAGGFFVGAASLVAALPSIFVYGRRNWSASC